VCNEQVYSPWLPIRILIVDEQQLTREGLRSLLENAEDIQVVGETDYREEALELTAILAPDLILLDLRMPVQTDLEVLSELRHRYPQSPVLILTALVDEEVIVRAMQLGVAGCLFKSVSPAELVNAIWAASQDSFHLDLLPMDGRGSNWSSRDSYRGGLQGWRESG
jgi:DNA-binding NarL/FixJ family response regulator